MLEVPVESIRPFLESRVESESEADDLYTSLSKLGQLAPILVRPSKSTSFEFELIFGYRRLSAAKKLGWKSINANIVEASDSEALMMAFSENVDRKGFTDYEKALILDKLHKTTGSSYDQLGDLIGRSRAFVSQHVAMLHLFSDSVAPRDEQLRVLSLLTENHARILNRIEDAEDRWNTAKLVVSSGMGVRELQRLYPSSDGKRNTKKRTRSTKREEIRELVFTLIEGLNNRDFHSFSTSLHSKEFSCYSDEPIFPSLGRDELQSRSYFEKQTSFKKNRSLKDLEVHVHGDVAYATFVMLFDVDFPANHHKRSNRSTCIFQRTNQGWKVVHMHCSNYDEPSKETISSLVENPVRLLQKQKRPVMESPQSHSTMSK